MTPLLASGIELMLVGMGTVFVFLTLLVAATRLMSSVVMRYFPAAAGPVRSAPAGTSEEEIAAISIALTEHLKKNNNRTDN